MQPQDPVRTRPTRLIIIVAAIVLFFGVFAAVLMWGGEKENPTTSKQPDTTHHTPLVRSSLVATGLQQPTAIVSTPDKTDKRLFVIEQQGTVRIVDASGTIEKAPFLDIHDKLKNAGEMGLLGLAFNPSFEQNGYFYVNYVNKNEDTVIARFKTSANNPSVADPASEKILLTVDQPYPNHKGGDLAFGPDGYLYITFGDGGSAGDPENRAQNKTTYLGKILRIDVNKGDPYAIPASNPFANETGVKQEIWAYGLRNPWRISFDSKTGDLYIADVGQGEYEEVNVQQANSKGGENYGWRCYEGLHTFKPDGCAEQSTFKSPILEYTHEENRCSVTGGYVYRGTQYSELAGSYFYSDFCNGQLFYAKKSDKGSYTSALAAQTPYSISAFGQGDDGELYFADYKTGSIYHLEDAANN
jgi:glucose/arabinose dehydrogenase